MSDRRPEHAKPPPPPAWALFEQAIGQRRCVAAFYHGEQRLLCPHALGWKVGRAKVLVYQAERVTGPGATPAERQPWRSMFVDEIEDPVITDDSWRTADNYTPICNNIDELAIDVNNSPSCSRQA